MGLLRSLVRAGAVTVAFALALPAIAVGGTPPAMVYHGTWDPTPTPVCDGSVEVSGVWNVNLKKDGTAEVSVRIFEHGRPHAAWGGNRFHVDFTQQLPAPANDVFEVIADFGGYGQLIFTLAADGLLTYELTGYCEDGGSAFLYGHLTH